MLALMVLAACASGVRKDVTQGFDEVAHVSYVAQVQRDGSWWPDLARLRLLDPKTFAPTAKANYLNHPPLYYDALAALGPRLAGAPGAVIVYRLINVVLAALAVGLLMALGLAARLELYAYCLPLLCIPVLVPLAGAVNNDNAAFLGGAMLLFGVFRFVEGGRAWLALALAGVIVAGWAKLTGLLLAGGALAMLAAYLLWRGRLSWREAAGIAVALAVAALPYAVFAIQYGSPAPDTAAQHALLRDGAHMAGWADRPRLSLAAYAVAFSGSFLANWMPALSGRSALQYAMLIVPLLSVLAALFGIGVSLRRIGRRRETALDAVTVAGAAAIAATFVLHLLFSYRRHVETGWMMDAYPRYYLPLIVIVPLGCLAAVSEVQRARLRRALTVALIFGPMVFRLLGGPLG